MILEEKIKLPEFNGKLLFLAITGSKAYNTHTENSDTDIKGVFITPTEEVLKRTVSPNSANANFYKNQVSDENNDTVLYEIGRFVELLEKNNPNILELLNIPKECIIFVDPVFQETFLNQRHRFLSKQIANTFSGYAYSQIKKAKGLNKKINKPQPKIRKDILEFCYVIEGVKSKPFWTWYKYYYHLLGKPFDKNEALEKISKWGLTKLPNGNQLFALYESHNYYDLRGMVKTLDSTELRLSSVPKDMNTKCLPKILQFNLNGFKVHCKEHREYWEWVEKRNQNRYNDNIKSGQDYDTKNMMHCVRLVDMAEDIFTKEDIIVKRPNRDRLMLIRKGEYPYEDILKYVEEKIENIQKLSISSPFPNTVDITLTRDFLLEIRLQNLNK